MENRTIYLETPKFKIVNFKIGFEAASGNIFLFKMLGYKKKKENHISKMVVTGFKKKLQNTQITINYSGRTNTEDFVILTPVLRNVLNGV